MHWNRRASKKCTVVKPGIGEERRARETTLLPCVFLQDRTTDVAGGA